MIISKRREAVNMPTTDELMKTLKSSRKIEDYLRSNEAEFVEFKLSEYLERLLKEKNLKKAVVIESSGLAREYAYQIFSGKKIPSRKKLLQICIGMKLNIEESQTLLKYTGFNPLYPRVKFDGVILYALEKKMTLYEINDLLYDNDLETFEA